MLEQEHDTPPESFSPVESVEQYNPDLPPSLQHLSRYCEQARVETAELARDRVHAVEARLNAQYGFITELIRAEYGNLDTIVDIGTYDGRHLKHLMEAGVVGRAVTFDTDKETLQSGLAYLERNGLGEDRVTGMCANGASALEVLSGLEGTFDGGLTLEVYVGDTFNGSMEDVVNITYNASQLLRPGGLYIATLRIPEVEAATATDNRWWDAQNATQVPDRFLDRVLRECFSEVRVFGQGAARIGASKRLKSVAYLEGNRLIYKPEAFEIKPIEEYGNNYHVHYKLYACKK